ncbi:MAG: RluA family pseudouridine synthase [Blastocatellia bacterium]
MLDRNVKVNTRSVQRRLMGYFFQFLVETTDAGRRVDDFFASRFGNLSQMRIANLIEAGACIVNGAAARAGQRIAPGDFVEISFDEGAPTAMSPEPIPLEIITEDDHLIVVVKPAGMLVHPTMSVKTGTLANALAYHLNKQVFGGLRSQPRGSAGQLTTAHQQVEVVGPDARTNAVSASPELETRDPEPAAHGQQHSLVRPGLVHRLDRATSGLIVVAKTPKALGVLSRHFRKRLVEKRYLALVRGTVEEAAGSITAPIGRDPDQRPHWRVIEGGKQAETRFKVIERLGPVTLLELEPVTGRTNQLRIHCAHLGHPIVGDDIHSDRGLPISDHGFRTDVRPREDAASANRDSNPAPRLCLHAWKLAFHHPAGGEWLEFTAPPPSEFISVVETLRR